MLVFMPLYSFPVGEEREKGRERGREREAREWRECVRSDKFVPALPQDFCGFHFLSVIGCSSVV